MNTKPLLLLILLFSLFGRGTANSAPQNNDFPENLRQLSLRNLRDTANYYFRTSSYDTSLMIYTLLIETPINENDIKQKKLIIDAYIDVGIIHYYMNKRKHSYDFYLKALDLCGNSSDYDVYKSKIYNNMGVTYSHFKKYDQEKFYYLKSLEFCKDTTVMIALLNNLSAIELDTEKTDSALFFLNEALQLSKCYHDSYLHAIINNIARVYEYTKQYDSAYYYYHLALNEARKQNNFHGEVLNLAHLGGLFFEIYNYDSAQYYINLSNDLATDNYFQNIVVENYLLLSKIELAKGNLDKSLEYHLRATHLNDSIFNASTLGDINCMQYDYDFAKINEQLEELQQELHEKKRTITRQLIIWLITIVVLLLIIGALLFLYRQIKKKKVHKQTTTQAALLPEKAQKELLNKIKTFMENNISIICRENFSINKLSKLIDSNQGYVSYVINKHLNRNFRFFLNEYRIKEAQRLLSDPDFYNNYTIETVASKVGFKSRGTFREVFKEITGVTPAEYLKSK